MRNVMAILAAGGLIFSIAACSDDDAPIPGKEAGVDMKVADQKVADDQKATDDQKVADDQAVTDTAPSNPYNSVSAITTFLEGKTLTMEGTNIPSHPNGFDENTNFGASTQCYSKVTITSTTGPKFSTKSDLGTLNGAPNAGDVGTCDRNTVSTSLTFDSTTVAIESVAADGSCFDITMTYTGFKQEGRGVISADGKTIKLELFFEGQATGHRCAGGTPGQANTVTLNSNAFTGDAVQTYAITTTN